MVKSARGIPFVHDRCSKHQKHRRSLFIPLQPLPYYSQTMSNPQALASDIFQAAFGVFNRLASTPSTALQLQSPDTEVLAEAMWRAEQEKERALASEMVLRPFRTAANTQRREARSATDAADQAEEADERFPLVRRPFRL